MQTAQPLPRLSAPRTAIIAGAVVIASLIFDLLELPIEAPPPFGVAALVLAGAALAWAGGGLAPAIIGGSGAIGLTVVLSASMHRAFGQTPWRMYAVEFLPLLVLTVGVVVTSLGAGWLGYRLLRRGEGIDLRPRGVLAAGSLALAVVAGGTLFAELIHGVVPANAQEVRVSIVDGALHVDPTTFSAALPTYLLMEAEAELIYLPVGSDADAARRMRGDLVDREGLAGFIAPRERTDGLRPASFVPGRYVLIAVEAEVPISESTVMVLEPGDPPPETRTMRTDVAPVEFTVTD